MVKYYTRACNFYYGNKAKNLIKAKKALPLCGSGEIAFNQIEVITRKKKKITCKTIFINELKNLVNSKKKKIYKDLKKITTKRKNFLLNVDFSEPTLMGILNLTPDSFSDGGKFNKKKVSLRHISDMVNSGTTL